MNVAVVGAGVFGVASALELSRRGHTVTIFERGQVPDPSAASTDVSKAIRRTWYGDSEIYVELVERAAYNWRTWQRTFPARVYHQVGQLLVLEDFEGRLSWTPLAASALATNNLTATGTDVFRGSRSGRFEFGKDTDRGIRGFYYSPTGGAIPVIASETFSVATGVGLGGTMIVEIGARLVPVKIVEIASYFPTANPDRGGFLVADLEALLRHLRMVSPTINITPNELLITHAPGAGPAVAESVVEIVGRAASVEIFDRAASLEGGKL